MIKRKIKFIIYIAILMFYISFIKPSSIVNAEDSSAQSEIINDEETSSQTENANDGMISTNRELHYYSDSTLTIGSWVFDNGGWRYLNSNGNIAKDILIKDTTGLCYLGSDGYWNKSEGWRYDKIIKKWTYIDSKGYALTDAFIRDSVGLCYMGKDGYWNTSEGWRYDKSIKNWIYIDNKGYAITDEFIRDSKGLCYIGKDAYWNTSEGWRYDKSIKNWAYIANNGYALTNTFLRDSKGLCNMGSDGYWNKSEGWSYNKSLKNWMYIGKDGYLLTETLVKDSKGLCYLGKDGHWNKSVGWRYDKLVNNWVYIGSDGYVLKDWWQKDSKGWCYLGKDGYWDKKTVNGPLAGKTVMLDPGHGGVDPGAHYDATSERNLNLIIANKVANQLKSQGCNIVMSRTTNNSSANNDIYERTARANAAGADIYVSIHHNAMPSNSGVSGIETYYYIAKSQYPPLPGNAASHNNPARLSNSQKLANIIQSELIKATGANNRGVKRGSYVVLRETQMPAVLLELGFMSNPTELNRLRSDSYQNTLSNAIVKGINDYFDK